MIVRAQGRRREVRSRLSLLAAALTAVGLAVAAVVMLLALQNILLRSADAATAARAAQIAEVIERSGLDGVGESLLAVTQNVTTVRVIDDAGREVLDNNGRLGRASLPSVGPGRDVLERHVEVPGSGEGFVVAATGVDFVADAEGPMAVYVGASRAPINQTIGTVGVLIGAVFPVVVVIIGVLAYVLVGRALRPVDEIRRRVADISAGDLSQRVPVPSGGDEISTLATTMNEMLERIETSQVRQAQFVNDASHELNSPLTTVLGLLDLSQATGQPVDPDTVGTVLLPEAQRMRRLVADLLFLARADEKGVPARREQVDLDEIVGAEVRRIEALDSVSVDARILAVRCVGDPGTLTRALRNITDNGARHARSSLRITMSRSISEDGSPQVTILVDDDGAGIPDADRSRVLDRFVRLSRSRSSDDGGSGLGLAIVAEIINAHGGHVIVDDAPEGGARVGFSLPLTASVQG